MLIARKNCRGQDGPSPVDYDDEAVLCGEASNYEDKCFAVSETNPTEAPFSEDTERLRLAP